MKVLKSKVAKAAVAGGIALAAVGAGAGIASADPGHDDRDQGRDHAPEQQHHGDPQPSQHGFWFFDQWVPLP